MAKAKRPKGITPTDVKKAGSLKDEISALRRQIHEKEKEYEPLRLKIMDAMRGNGDAPVNSGGRRLEIVLKRANVPWSKVALAELGDVRVAEIKAEQPQVRYLKIV